MSYCGTFHTLDFIPLHLIPLDLIPLDLIPLDLIRICRLDLIPLDLIPVSHWASLPIYTGNHHLTDLIENSDPLSIKTAPIGTGKLIGLLYSDALHNKLCCTTKCFRQPKPTERTPNPLPAHVNCW